jgi:hypothetical protein
MLNLKVTSKGRALVFRSRRVAVSRSSSPARWTAMKYFEKMPYDVITTGNHELYKYPVALSVYENLAQHYASRYVVRQRSLVL